MTKVGQFTQKWTFPILAQSSQSNANIPQNNSSLSSNDGSPVTRSLTDGTVTEQDYMTQEITNSNINSIAFEIIGQSYQISRENSISKLSEVINNIDDQLKNKLYKLIVVLGFMCEKNLHGSNDRTHITTDSRGMSINVKLVLDCLKTLSSSGVSFNKEIAWHFIYLCVEPWYKHQKQSTHQIPEKTKKFLTSVLGIKSGIIETLEGNLNDCVWRTCCASKGLKEIIDNWDSIFNIPKVTPHESPILTHQDYIPASIPIIIPISEPGNSEDSSITPIEASISATSSSGSGVTMSSYNSSNLGISLGSYTSSTHEAGGNKNNSNEFRNPTSDAEIFRDYSPSVLTPEELAEILPGDEIYNIFSEEIQLNIFKGEQVEGQKDTTTD